MHKLLFAGSVSTQQSPTQQFGSRLSWLVKVLLVMTILMGMKTVFAYSYTCSSSSLQSPFPARVVDSPLQDGNVISHGSLVIQLGGCTNASSDGDTDFSVSVPTDSLGISLQGASGVTVASTSLLDPVVTTDVSGPLGASCSLTSKSYVGGFSKIVINHPIGATCSYTVTFPMSLTMHSGNGAIAGVVGNDLTSRSPINGGSGWVFYSGAANNSVGLSRPLTLITSACTLSTNNVTVTLPTIGSSALSGGAGKTAGRTPFTLALSGCSNVGAIYSAKASWTFVEGAAGAKTIANSAVGPASNVYVQLLDSVMVPLRNGGSSFLASVSTIDHYQIQHYAQYYAGGVVGSGLVKGVATLSLFYE